MKYHLEYLFAGTGAKEYRIDLNSASTSELHHSVEDLLISMIADILRARKGDFVVFYVQQNNQRKFFEGKFYGIFKVKADTAFLDNYDTEQFLSSHLGKSLTFRILIEPYQVYPKGVSEWEALDEIEQLRFPHQMLWSLIYRKLKARRGNTMITIYESERLFKLLRDKNRTKSLDCSHFSFDLQTQEIVCETQPHPYLGRQEAIQILPRLIQKYRSGLAFEVHLQAYITQNIGRNSNPTLDSALLTDGDIEWLGNEVYCGVGLQKIDVMLSITRNKHRFCIPIELKAVMGEPRHVSQIQRYVDWLRQYYVPNRASDIQPILVAKRAENKRSENYSALIKRFSDFNARNPECLELKYVEFSVAGNDLVFEPISY
jgi:hypothetical protein